MKTLLLTSLLFLIFSCQNNNTAKENFEIKNAQKIVEQFNSTKMPDEKGKFYEGDIEIITTKNEIVVFLTDEKEASFYHLQIPSSSLIEPLRKSLTAQVLKFDKHLIINDLKSDYLIGLTVDEILPEYLSEINVEKNYKGFGLAAHGVQPLEHGNDYEKYHGIESIYEVF